MEFQLQEIVDNWKSAGVDLPEMSLSFDPRLDSSVLERMRPDVVDHLVRLSVRLSPTQSGTVS